ncbi:MAG: M20/M25/M40 family metallo-hydrolase [Bacteriovoracaceae bacterium]
MKNLIIFLCLSFLSPAGKAADFDWKKFLQDIVDINSSTSNPDGLEEVRKRIIPEFEGLGYKHEIIDAKEGRKVLVFRNGDAPPKAILIGHIDTVFDKTSPFQKFRDDGNFLQGPGVMDMKGGIALMLLALHRLDAVARKNIVIALNDDEEIGSPNSSPILKKLAAGVPYGLVYEPTSASPEHVTTSQSGIVWLELKVKGKAAHAGMDHEIGVNACVELAHKIVELAKLTDYPKKLTVNPGVIQGGTKANVVCDEATVKVDVRYVNEKDLKAVRAKIQSIADKSFVFNKNLKMGTRTEIKEIVFVPSLPQKDTDKIFLKAQEIGKKLGINLQRNHIGGASDAIQLAPTGMNLLVGLGPYGTGAHSEEEKMDPKSFELRTLLNVELIKMIVAE